MKQRNGVGDLSRTPSESIMAAETVELFADLWDQLQAARCDIYRLISACKYGDVPIPAGIVEPCWRDLVHRDDFEPRAWRAFRRGMVGQ